MNTKYIFIALLVIASIFLASLLFKSDIPEIKYIKGKDSVVTKTDTVTQYIPKYIATEKIISDTVHIHHFNNDSSIVKDTVVHDMDTVIATITTYPVIDSLKLKLDLRLTEKLTTIHDSIWITRIDTLKTVELEPTTWYDSFLTGFLSAIAIITGILLIP